VQGLNFKAGVWHHPLVALGTPCDFACLVWESGVAADDCHVVNMRKAEQVLVHVSECDVAEDVDKASKC
jgi:ureidoglycolate hydrolase